MTTTLPSNHPTPPSLPDSFLLLLLPSPHTDPAPRVGLSCVQFLNCPSPRLLVLIWLGVRRKALDYVRAFCLIGQLPE